MPSRFPRERTWKRRGRLDSRRNGHNRGMAEIPHETPGPSGPGRSQATGDPADSRPAVKGAEAGRSGQVGPEDTGAGSEGPHPDPDEYADPATQGTHAPEDARGR
jgi:hypothetical protein